MATSINFTPLNKFFDHIYVITLEREIEKQERVAELLDGLNYEFFYGVDKKDLTLDALIENKIYDEQKAIELHRYNKPMNTGLIGCCWSHRNVYEDILQKGYKKVLILEDDAVPQKEGFAELEETLAELPGNWELLYMDYHKNIKRNLGTFFVVLYYHVIRFFNRMKWSHTTIANLYCKKFSKHIKHAGYHDYTSAYAITDTAAKQLLALQQPIAFLADNLLAHACTNKLVTGFITIPKVFAQSGKIEKTSPVVQ